MIITPEHEAALDALEGMVRLHVHCSTEPTALDGYDEDNAALRALVLNGRMRWCDGEGDATSGEEFACFLPSLLSDEALKAIDRMIYDGVSRNELMSHLKSLRAEVAP